MIFASGRALSTAGPPAAKAKSGFDERRAFSGGIIGRKRTSPAESAGKPCDGAASSLPDLRAARPGGANGVEADAPLSPPGSPYLSRSGYLAVSGGANPRRACAILSPADIRRVHKVSRQLCRERECNDDGGFGLARVWWTGASWQPDRARRRQRDPADRRSVPDLSLCLPPRHVRVRRRPAAPDLPHACQARAGGWQAADRSAAEPAGDQGSGGVHQPSRTGGERMSPAPLPRAIECGGQGVPVRGL